jgi:hypothetical protein
MVTFISRRDNPETGAKIYFLQEGGLHIVYQVYSRTYR